MTLDNFKQDIVNKMLSKIKVSKHLFFCGKLNWIDYIFDEIKALYPDKRLHFIDIDEAQSYTKYSAHNIIAIEDTKEWLIEESCYIICSRWHLDEYYNELVKFEVNNDNIFFYPSLLLALDGKLSDMPTKYGYSVETSYLMMHNVFDNADLYTELLMSMSDGESKELLCKIIQFRLCFDLRLTQNVKTKNVHYWDTDIYYFSDRDIIVDAGGYIGDTLASYCSVVDKKHNCRKYHLFEPTSAIEKARLIGSKCSFEVEYHQYGVYDTDGTVSFSMRLDTDGTLLGVSNIDDEGETLINVCRMDSVLNDIPTFVKMDIEGSELAALNGGKELFDNSTSFAICAYHKVNDIIDIWKWLKEEGSYRFYMRAERDNLMVDYVLYAIADVAK